MIRLSVNVNKVATAVELRFDVRASALPEDMKARLVSLAGSRMTTDGVLLIDSREHRTQAQNRADARAKLAGLIRAATHKPNPRRKTRPTAAAKRRRLEIKRRQGETKRARAKNLSDE